MTDENSTREQDLREELDLAKAEIARLESTFSIVGDPGPLFLALSKAQAGFDAIHRTREVQVRSEKANYTFAYAPLDEILRATGKGLTDNELALTQVICGPAASTEIRTILGHSEGAYIQSAMRLPEGEREPQKLGSAITYLRRYAIQAILGVAAEEDDDGAAPGTQAVTPRNVAAKPVPAPVVKAAKGETKHPNRPIADGAKPDLPPRPIDATRGGGGPMTEAQYEAIGAAFGGTTAADVPKVCMDVVGKEPPESFGAASGWTAEDAEKLLAHLKGAA